MTDCASVKVIKNFVSSECFNLDYSSFLRASCNFYGHAEIPISPRINTLMNFMNLLINVKSQKASVRQKTDAKNKTVFRG